MLSKYRKELNIVFFFYIIGCVHVNKKYEGFMVFLSKSIISDGPIKLKITQLASGKNVCRLRTFKS